MSALISSKGESRNLTPIVAEVASSTEANFRRLEILTLFPDSTGPHVSCKAFEGILHHLYTFRPLTL